MNLAQKIVLRSIASYQKWISPLLGSGCRFVPTCSEYAEESITRYGIWRGMAYTIARLLRCHPFAAAGLDPVPHDPHCGHTHAERIHT